MKVIFISNYFNHHQKELSDWFFKLTHGNYYFISTQPMSPERKNLGYLIYDEKYLISYSSDTKDNIQHLISAADVVIIGSADERFITARKRSGKLIFRYSERPLKKGLEFWKYPYRFIKWHLLNPKNARIYLLCSSAYTSFDYTKFGLFKEKCFKWGYFPECKCYDDIATLINNKKKNSILWCGRFIELKHPEVPILIAERLKSEGFKFCLSMIGTGEMIPSITKMIKEKRLEDCVSLLGSLPSDKVRSYMEKSQIFLFTSDFNEGWGAVLNESMNSCCAVVASHAIGSVPYLIRNTENGLVYMNGDFEDLYSKVRFLLINHEKRAQIAKAAYSTIADEWNSQVAAIRLVALCNELLTGGKQPKLYEEGPCSIAKSIPNFWFQG